MMFEFALAIALSFLVSYLPGYFVSRFLAFDRISSLLGAPIFSTALYVGLGVAFEIAGFTCSATVLLFVSFIVGFLLFALRKAVSELFLHNDRCPEIKIIPFKPTTSLWILALFCLLAFAVTYIVFISILATPDALAKYDDNTAHFSTIRSFIDTGTFSTLKSSPTLDVSGTGSFYPSAWHIQVAITASVFSENIALAANAMLVEHLVVVIPSAVFLFLSQITNDKMIVACGSLFSVSFGAYPWGFIIFGQLLPNMLAFAYVVIVMAFVICFLRKYKTLRYALRFGPFLLTGLISIAVAQPNGLFTLGIWLGVYIAFDSIYNFKKKRFDFTEKNVLKSFAICIFAALVWVVLFNAPPLQGVINFVWPANHSVPGAFREALLFIFTGRSGMQLFLSVMVAIGVIVSLKKRNYLWLTLAYVISLLIYVVGDSSDGFLKHFLAGFWYTDPYRTGAMNALFAMPLAVLGFSYSVKGVSFGVLSAIKRRKAASRVHSGLITGINACLLAIIMAVFQFTNFATFPIGDRNIQTALLACRDYLEWRYSPQKWLTSEEINFADKALEIIPDGATVINIPNDGSQWLHGENGLNAFYRRVVFGDDIDADGQAIRMHLNEIDANPDVQKAVKDSDAHYVLLLDDKRVDGNTIMDDYAYLPEKWAGIDGVNEETPGFELLLEDGDMRLYKIDDKYFG